MRLKMVYTIWHFTGRAQALFLIVLFGLCTITRQMLWASQPSFIQLLAAKEWA